jgi:hypothetical protein
MSSFNNRQLILLKWLPSLFSIPGVSGSEIISGTSYVDWGFLQVLQSYRNVTLNQAKPPPLTFFPIHCSLVTLSFDAIAELKSSLNETRININSVTKNWDYFALGCLLYCTSCYFPLLNSFRRILNIYIQNSEIHLFTTHSRGVFEP